ncbi:MAG: hypothetical protein L0Z53_09350 [Acidobacteriales bacterium]|nr:hypothetical protein [Terriglobales bacterium]
MKRSKAVIVAAFLAVMFGQEGFTQTRKQLRIVQTTPLQFELSRPSVLIGKCDSQGNIYLPEMIDSDNFGPVARISSDGSKLTRFELLDDEVGETHITAFAAGQQPDRFYLAGMRIPDVDRDMAAPGSSHGESNARLTTSEKPEPQPFIASFNGDGKLLGELKLPRILPLQLAVLTSGDLLVAGLAANEAGEMRNFLGVFGQDGKLFREVKLPAERLNHEAVFASTYSSFEVADDGYLYLMRRGTEGPIHVIAPDGDVFQSIKLTPAKGTRLLNIKAARNRLVTISGRVVPAGIPGSFGTQQVVFGVLNPHSGQIEAEYEIGDASLGVGNFACYTAAGSFVFLQRKENRFDLITAEPR